MTERKNDDELGQLSFDAEAHKQELEKYLKSNYDKAEPSELVRAQLEHLRDSTAGAEPADSVSRSDEGETSTPGLIEWAQSRGLLPKEDESEGEYIARIRLAKFKAKKTQKEIQNPSSLDSGDQGNLF